MSHINPWYKDSPLGPIPQDWEVVYLKNIANLITKGTTPQYFVENGINFIKTECFVDDSIDQDKCLFVDEKTHNNFLSRSILKENDILFAIAGSIGKCNIVLKEILPANTNQALAIIRLKDEKTIGYVLQVLKSILIQEYIYLNVSAGAQPNLSLEQIGNFSFPLPPLPEQQAITTILKTTDETIQGIQELIKKLELRNKWLQENLLSGKKRIKGFGGEWKTASIKSFAEEISEKNKSNEELIVLSCTKYDWLVPSLEYFGRKIYSDDLTTYKIVSKNCFAYATNHIEEGSIGYQNKYEKALISPMYTVFKTDGTIDDKYLFKLLKTHYYIHEYQKRMEWSIDRRGWLRRDEFSKIKVPILSLEEQKAIDDLLHKTVEEVALYKEKLAKLKQTKKWLMQQLLTGKVRVKI